MSSYPAAGMQLAFDADLQPWAEGMDYAAVRVPSAITEQLGTHGPVLVLAQVNASSPFQVSLFPVGSGQHFIRIKSKVRREIEARIGDRVCLRFTVLDRATVDIPEDMRSALEGGHALADFEAYPPGKQNFIIRRIGEAVKPETRVKRIQAAVQAVLAERETPDDPRPAAS